MTLIGVMSGLVVILVTIVVIYNIQMKSRLQERWDRINQYLESNRIHVTTRLDYGRYHIFIDTYSRTFLIVTEEEKAEDYLPLYFGAITGMNVVEDGQGSNVIGNALVGGYFFGLAGAAIGAKRAKPYITSKSLIIYTNLFARPSIQLQLIEQRTEIASPQYQDATRFISQCEGIIRIIINENQLRIR